MGNSTETVQCDRALIQKYTTPLPHYTSYPPATQLTTEFSELDLRSAIAASNARKTPLSLDVQIPFCQSTCYYCGGNVIVSSNRRIAIPYVEYLVQEIQQTAALIDRDRPITQIHWGGGTPNYLTLEQVDLLWQTIARHFTLAPAADVSIKINPRYVDRNYIQALRAIGFNRISFGIQDFDPQVQAAVNRIQPEAMLRRVMDWVKAAAFASVKIDLTYGLPYQTLPSFRDTLQKTIALDPDLIAVSNFTYRPWLKPIQQQIEPEALPSPVEKLAILQMTIAELTQHQYQLIGMEQFAKSTDHLAVAHQQHRLTHNFQSYTTPPNTERLGFGLSAISMFEDTYSQNHTKLGNYYQAIDTACLPVEKGLKLSRADLLRRDVIMQLMLHGCLVKSEFADRYGITFDTYFAPELEALKLLETDGLVNLLADAIVITSVGQLVIRTIANVFDIHTQMTEELPMEIEHLP